MNEKCIIGVVGIGCLTILQTIAWSTGHNGTVFALTSAGIGAIIGSYFDLKSVIKK